MSVYTFGQFRLDRSKRLLERDGVQVRIGGRTLDLLIALVDQAGDVVSIRELMQLTWPNVTVEEANLRVAVSALRKVLGDGQDGARYILNVAGRGYSFVAPVQAEKAAKISINGAACGNPRRRPLPDLPKFLVGREETVGTLCTLLESQRFVSIVGPGGIGKTTAALAVAHALRPKFGDDQICFVDAGAISEPADLPAAIASALGCAVQTSDAIDDIAAFLADTPTLLVVDGCEHIIEAAAAVCEKLFQSTSAVYILVTSCEALRVDGENVLIVRPLHYPLADAPTALEAIETPAVQLFMERAARSGYLSRLTDEDAPIVSYICRRLDGIALAIELVASRVCLYGIRGTADLLNSGSELVLQGRRNASPRHQTLQALHDWSYRLLSEQEQTILARLSIFTSEFTLAAAHAVAGEPGDDRKAIAQALTNLSDKSLIQVCSRQGFATYKLRDTTRAYVSHKLVERRELDLILRRHASYATCNGTSEASYVAPTPGDTITEIPQAITRASDASIGMGQAAYAA